jgi:hypothetical protein
MTDTYEAILAENEMLAERNQFLEDDNQRLRAQLKKQRRSYPRGVMTFGKWENTPITEVNTWYLEWVLQNAFDPRDLVRKQTRQLRDDIVEELQFRKTKVDRGEVA